MKIVDKMSYVVWIHDKETCSTVSFYGLTGADYKDVLPHIVTFNRATASKVKVEDPMPWGKARAHTWEAIVTNKLLGDDGLYAHLAPDGANMSDYDVFDYWVCCEGAKGAHASRRQSKEDFLRHLDELVVKTAVADDSLSDAEKKAVALMDKARQAAEAAEAAMRQAAEASKAAMAERGRANAK